VSAESVGGKQDDRLHDVSTVREPAVESTATTDADLDAQWRAELRRRIDEIRSGRVRLRTREESRQDVRTVLDELRGR